MPGTDPICSSDWLWPSVSLLPQSPTYGPWPQSGFLTLLSSRGNSPSYNKGQGRNYALSSINYGPLPSLFKQIFGWYSLKRSSLDKSFHTYVMEWDERFMRFYTDTRVTAMLDIGIGGKKGGFWERGG